MMWNCVRICLRDDVSPNSIDVMRNILTYLCNIHYRPTSKQHQMKLKLIAGGAIELSCLMSRLCLKWMGLGLGSRGQPPNWHVENNHKLRTCQKLGTSIRRDIAYVIFWNWAGALFDIGRLNLEIYVCITYTQSYPKANKPIAGTRWPRRLFTYRYQKSSKWESDAKSIYLCMFVHTM